MKTINYNGVTITPIYKEMLVWDDYEDWAIIAFVIVRIHDAKNVSHEYSVLKPNGCLSSCKHAKEIQSETKQRTIEDGLEYGDIVISKDGEKRKVLGVCGDIIFLSYNGNFDMFSMYVTLKQLIKHGYKLYTEKVEQPKTISIEEAKQLLKSQGINNIEIK